MLPLSDLPNQLPTTLQDSHILQRGLFRENHDPVGQPSSENLFNSSTWVGLLIFKDMI